MLPTPCTAGLDGGSHVREKARAAVAFPTPVAGTGNYNRKGASATSGDGLLTVVRKLGHYPTPRSIDAHSPWKGEKSPGLHVVGGGNGGMLNPDWVEWLMCWPVGWTDVGTPNDRLSWLHPSRDPADAGGIPRTTARRENRAARIKAIGNGQFPPTAFAAFAWGVAVLEAYGGLKPAAQNRKAAAV